MYKHPCNITEKQAKTAFCGKKKKGISFYSVILTGQIAWIVMKIFKKERRIKKKKKKNPNILAT